MTAKLRVALVLFNIMLLQPRGARADEPNNAAAARVQIKSTFGFVPGFLQALPDAVLPGAWDELKGLVLSETALPPAIKAAIGLAVAAQVPSREWSYAQRELGKLKGANAAELDEALALSALTRHWSTVFHGLQLDLAKFRSELARGIEHLNQVGSGSIPPPRPVLISDASSALADIAQAYGMVPEYLQRFPLAGLVGAWRQERALEMNPLTALSGRQKSLIGLAVAAQIPCRFCVLADTEFAKLQGASEREIEEAIAIAALTRELCTFWNGMDLDAKAFRKDVDRMIAALKKHKGTSPSTSPSTSTSTSQNPSTSTSTSTNTNTNTNTNTSQNPSQNPGAGLR